MMIVLGKEEIEKMVDLNQMMDQIEEAYRIFGTGEYYMPPRPTGSLFWHRQEPSRSL